MSNNKEKSFQESLQELTVSHIKKLSRESELASGIKRKAGTMKDRKKEEEKYASRGKKYTGHDDRY